MNSPESAPEVAERTAPAAVAGHLLTRRILKYARRAVLAVVVLIIALMLLRYYTKPGPVDLSGDVRFAAAGFPFNLATGTKLGSDEAPVKMLEFEDFQCPFCLRYVATQEPTLVKEYVETGKLQIIHVNLIRLGAESTDAAIASQCAADQDRFWQYYLRLYLAEAEAGQNSNEQSNVGRFSRANLESFGRDVGLDPAQFANCLSSGDHAGALADDQRQATSFGVTGTPGFVINGQPRVGAPASMDDWRTLLDKALRGAPH